MRGTEKERHVVQRGKGREDRARIGNVGVIRTDTTLSPLALVLVPPSSRSLLAGPCRRLPLQIPCPASGPAESQSMLQCPLGLSTPRAGVGTKDGTRF